MSQPTAETNPRNSISSIRRKPAPSSSDDNVVNGADANGRTNGHANSAVNTRNSSGSAVPKFGASKPTGSDELTPTRAHYLLKALVNLEHFREWSALSEHGALVEFGPPFGVSHDTKGSESSASKAGSITEPAMLRGAFRSHLLKLPGLNTAPNSYFTRRAQPWFDDIASRGLSTTVERGEPTKRFQLNMLLTRLLGSWYARGILVSFDDGQAATLKQDTAARPGPREIAAINSIFPSASASPEGWYVGVFELSEATGKFVVGSQRKGEKPTFTLKSLDDVKTLNSEVRISRSL